MLVKLLGIADFIIIIIIALLHYDLLGWRIGLTAATYLIMKAVIFKGNITSILDGLCGIYIILLSFGVHSIITWIIAIYLLQKSAFSIAA